MHQFRKHKSWHPTKKLYYKQYSFVIRIGAMLRGHDVVVPTEFSEYRRVDREDGLTYTQPPAFTRTCSIYTNDLRLIEYLLSTYNELILVLESPYNEQHAEYLNDPNRNIIYRDKPWYHKYHHKLNVYESWRQSNKPNPALVIATFQELFQSADSKWAGQGKEPMQFYHSSRWFSYPTIYTNNEASIMLFKLAHGDVLRLSIETIVTPEFLK